MLYSPYYRDRDVLCNRVSCLGNYYESLFFILVLSCPFVLCFLFILKSNSPSFQNSMLPAPMYLLRSWLVTPPWLFPPVPLTLCIYCVSPHLSSASSFLIHDYVQACSMVVFRFSCSWLLQLVFPRKSDFVFPVKSLFLKTTWVWVWVVHLSSPLETVLLGKLSGDSHTHCCTEYMKWLHIHLFLYQVDSLPFIAKPREILNDSPVC